MEKELFNKIKCLLQKKKSFADLIKELEMSDKEVLGLIDFMKMKGENIQTYLENGEVQVKYSREPRINGNVYVIGNPQKIIKTMFISDTHLGNKAERFDLIKAAYDEAKKRGITQVLHFGDITDGYYTNRPNQIYELKKFGADEQAENVVENYPYDESITTNFITGNHDITHMRNGGNDIGKMIAKDRKDMNYLGHDEADINLNGLKIRMRHGAGGASYARSYKLQKYAENLYGELKPHILGQGHWHTPLYLEYRGMHCFQCSSMEDETPFSRSLGLPNNKGVWFVEAHMNKGEVVGLIPELVVFNDKAKVKRR